VLGGKAAASSAAQRSPQLLTTPPATLSTAMEATARVLGSRLKARQVRLQRPRAYEGAACPPPSRCVRCTSVCVCVGGGGGAPASASHGGAVLTLQPAQIDAAAKALTAALGSDGVVEAIANNTALLAVPPATINGAWAALQEVG
jgi:hypothetical protein